MPRAAVLLLASLTACAAPTARDAAKVTTRDSAGVTIVEYPQSIVPKLPEWQLGDALTVLGGEDADESHDMTGVIDGLLDDAGFVVADETNMQLRRFSTSGELLAATGGRGSGPGELLYLSQALLFPDGLAALDFGRGVLVIYDDSLRYSREVAFREFDGGTRFHILGIEPDGAILASGGPMQARSPELQTSEIRRDPEVVERLHPGNGRIDTLFSTAGREYYHLTSGTRSRRFGMASFVARSADGFVSSEGERWEIVGRDSSGAIRRVMRLDLPRRPVTEAMRAEQLRLDHMEIDALPPGGFVGIRRMAALDFADPRFPDSLPPFDQSRFGRDGTLWLREGTAPSDSLQRWLVFHRDSLLATLSIPTGFDVLDAQRDRVLLRRTDSLDIGYIELREIRVGG